MRLMLFGYSIALALLTGLMLLGETHGQGVGGTGSTCFNVTLGPCANNTAFADGPPDYNTSIGNSSLPNTSAGSSNTSLGFGSLFPTTTGSDNVGIGYVSLGSNSSGSFNVAVGFEALQSANANSNVAIGFVACGDVTTGTNNVCLGTSAGRGLTIGSNNTILGSNVTGLPSGLNNAIILSDGLGTIRADFGKTTSGQWTLPQTAFTAPVIMNTYTFATLPACAAAIKGARAFISDGAATPTFTAAAAGGGTLFTPVYCDGTSWRNG